MNNLLIIILLFASSIVYGQWVVEPYSPWFIGNIKTDSCLYFGDGTSMCTAVSQDTGAIKSTGGHNIMYQSLKFGTGDTIQVGGSSIVEDARLSTYVDRDMYYRGNIAGDFDIQYEDTVTGQSVQMVYIAKGSNGLIGAFSPTWAAGGNVQNERLSVIGGVKGLVLQGTGANASVKVTSQNAFEVMTGDGTFYSPAYSPDFIVATNKNVGIGVVAPTQKLDISGRAKITDSVYVNNSNNVGLDILSNVTTGTYGFSSTEIGIKNTVKNYNAQPVAGKQHDIVGDYIDVQNKVDTVSSATGSVILVSNQASGTGTISRAVGQVIQTYKTVGHITDAIGMEIVVDGADSNNTGIYINTNVGKYGKGIHIKSIAGTSSKYGIFQEGSTISNYFNGNVGVNTITPTEKLDIAGNIKTRSTDTVKIGKVMFSDNTMQTTALMKAEITIDSVRMKTLYANPLVIISALADTNHYINIVNAVAYNNYVAPIGDLAVGFTLAYISGAGQEYITKSAAFVQASESAISHFVTVNDYIRQVKGDGIQIQLSGGANLTTGGSNYKIVIYYTIISI